MNHHTRATLKNRLRPWALVITSPRTTSYAQGAEDVIILKLLETMGITPRSCTYLDVGANHPQYISTTYALYRAGARGTVVEPNPAFAPVWRLTRRRDTLLQAGISHTGKGGSAPYWAFHRHTLNTFSAAEATKVKTLHPDEAGVAPIAMPLITWAEALGSLPQTPTVVNLDVEGLDVELLQTFPFAQHHPLIWCVESVAYSMGGTHTKVPEVARIMEKNGYLAIAETHVNTIFVSQKAWEGRGQ